MPFLLALPTNSVKALKAKSTNCYLRDIALFTLASSHMPMIQSLSALSYTHLDAMQYLPCRLEKVHIRTTEISRPFTYANS